MNEWSGLGAGIAFAAMIRFLKSACQRVVVRVEAVYKIPTVSVI